MAIYRRVESRAMKITLWVMAIVILVPAAFGFGDKLWEFIHTLNTVEDAGYTIIPISTYFLVAGGMACLFGWAIYNGMFKDIEAPKYDMLEHEQELDEHEGFDWSGK